MSATKRRASLVAMKRAVDGCAGEDVEHLLAVALTAARLDRVAEHQLRAGVVHARLEDEPAAEARILDRPAGQGPRDFLHVLLRVAAVHAERVQLHQLAGVVLVEAAAAAILRGRRDALSLLRFIVPIAPTTADAMSERVEVMTRDVKVEALKPCSAPTMK